MIDEIHLGSIFLLFIALSSNFLASLFPCEVVDIFTKSHIAKHILAYMTLLFALILNNYKGSQPIVELIGISIILYIFFMIITKMEAVYFFILIFLLCIIYILGIIKKDKLDITKWIIFSIAIAVTIVGFLRYLYKTKQRLGTDFHFYNFIIGDYQCYR